MKRSIETYDGKTYDVIVIGGGITGAAVAYDAASRGLSVALVEKQDFGGATSAATSKLIHGGFRYIANLEFGIVRESLRERRIMGNIAPNLVYPIQVLVPCYTQGVTRHTWAIRLGMLLYDFLSYDKGSPWDRSKRIGFHRKLSAAEGLVLEPAIPRDGLKAVFSYHDGASLFPERLTLAFIKSAVKHGAAVSNYSKVERFIYSAGNKKKIAGVQVRDLINNRSVELKGKLTINCGGPWADLILDTAGGKSTLPRIRRSEGIHILTKKPACNSLVAMVASSGKGFVMCPWRGHTLIGPTDKEYEGNPDDYRVTESAVLELIDTVNVALRGSERIEYADVIHSYGGLRPLVGDAGKSVRESSRGYEVFDGARDGHEGLITVEGGKYTTSRSLAQNVVNMVFRKLKLRRKKCVTAEQHLAGCEISDINAFIADLKAKNTDLDEMTVERLGRYYGAECGEVLELARSDKSLSERVNQDGELLAQALYAVRAEMALTLNDILMRRTAIGTLGDPGADGIAKVAAVAAKELNWNDTRKAEEIRKAKGLFVIPQAQIIGAHHGQR